MSNSSPRLVMPEDEYAIVTEAWRQWLDSPLKAALEQAIDDAVAAERARADRAEAKLAEVRQLVGNPGWATPAEVQRKVLAIIDAGQRPVTAAALRSYLEATGWHEKSSGPAGTLWTLGIRTDGVGVPHDDSDPEAVRAAVVRVAKREHRSAAEVTADILAAEGSAGNDQ